MPAVQPLPLCAVLAFEGVRVYQAWTKEPTVCPAFAPVRGCVVDDFGKILQKADTSSANVIVEGIPVDHAIVKIGRRTRGQDARTLWVDWDPQWDRFKEWRHGCG